MPFSVEDGRKEATKGGDSFLDDTDVLSAVFTQNDHVHSGTSCIDYV